MQSLKLRHTQPSSLLGSRLQSTLGLGLAALVVVGISGTLYKLVSADGWVAFFFERTQAGGVLAVGGIGLAALCAWAAGMGATHSYRLLLSNFVVYGSALAGSIYLLRYWWAGIF